MSSFQLENKSGRKTELAACCNVIALVFMFFVAFSPLALWTQGILAISPSNTSSSTFLTQVGTGPFVATVSTQPFPCGGNCDGVVRGQWVSWGDISSSDACEPDSDVFNLWSGRYGFCNNGSFSKTSEIKALQAFASLALIFLLLSSCAGCSVSATRSRGANIAAVLTFLAMISSVIAFSVAASFQWYTDLRNGVGSMPFFTTSGNLIAINDIELHFGPPFGLTVLVFVITLFTFLAFVSEGRRIKQEQRDIAEGDSVRFHDNIYKTHDDVTYV